MAKFTFTGDPRAEGKDRTEGGEIFGIAYEAGKPFEVPDDATAKGADGVPFNIAERLRRHNHFTEGTVKAASAEKPAAGGKAA